MYLTFPKAIISLADCLLLFVFVIIWELVCSLQQLSFAQVGLEVASAWGRLPSIRATTSSRTNQLGHAPYIGQTT